MMGSLVFLVFAGAALFILLRIRSQQAAQTFVCRSCLTEAPAKTVTPGSFLIEVFLWLCLIVPGVIYSLWRVSARKRACSACGSPDLVPSGTPMAARLRAQG